MLMTYEGIVKQGHIRLPVGAPAPEGARVLVTFLPRLDERAAHRKANLWLGENVGNMVMADRPELRSMAGGRQVWHFGAFVTSLSRDPFGPIGYVDIDSETGVVLTGQAEAEAMADRGERLELAA
jgi:hypothetical protein